YFQIGQATGIITTTIDLRAATEANIVLTVSVTDGTHTIDDFDIFITIDNLNDRPQITNLPASVTIPETTVGGFQLITLTFTDVDTYVSQLIPTCTVVPAGDQYKFTYVSGTHKIQVATLSGATSPFDFETTSEYEITCVLNDGFQNSVGDVLTVNIENVNEAPQFDEVAYWCILTESSAGVSVCDLDASIVDPEGDTISSVTFQAGNNSQRFVYDRSLSTVTFGVDYDVDNNNMPTSVTLQLEAKDVNGASNHVPVYITINDANDNTCKFGATSV
ncbi:hypothetical protein EGW08_016067, partial [Elysia chlorotica]